MLCTKVRAIYSKNHRKLTHRLLGQNPEQFKVETGGTAIQIVGMSERIWRRKHT